MDYETATHGLNSSTSQQVYRRGHFAAPEVRTVAAQLTMILCTDRAKQLCVSIGAMLNDVYHLTAFMHGAALGLLWFYCCINKIS